MSFAVIALALLTTALARYLIASRGGDFGHQGRPRNPGESVLVWGSAAMCLVISAEHFLDLGPWLTEPRAPWTAVPALLWTLGMLVAGEHPLDRTATGAGLSTALPHVYQGVLEGVQMPATYLAGGLILFTMAWCWRRKDGAEA